MGEVHVSSYTEHRHFNKGEPEAMIYIHSSSKLPYPCRDSQSPISLLYHTDSPILLPAHIKVSPAAIPGRKTLVPAYYSAITAPLLHY